MGHTMGGYHRDQRKVLLINPKFQWKFIGYTLAVVTLAIGAFYVSDLYFFMALVKKGQAINLSPDHAYFALIREQKAFMDKVFILTSLVVFLTVVAAGIFLSHRIAGPMYRLQKYFEAAKEDGHELKELKFREKDFFMEIPESFNAFAEKRELFGKSA